MSLLPARQAFFAAPLVGLFGLALQRPVFAGCPAALDDLAVSTRSTIAAFSAMDPGAFAETLAVAQEQARCLDGIPTPSLAAAVHEVAALDAYLKKDFSGVVVSLRAMHEADPTMVLPVEVAPPGGALAGRDEEARRLSAAERVPVGLPAEWTLVVDGRPATLAPASRQALVVLVSPFNQVIWSGLAAAQEIPVELAFGWQSGASTGVVSADAGRRSRKRAARVVGWSGAGMAALSGVLWVATVQGAHRLDAVQELPDGDITENDWHNVGLDPMTVDEIIALYGRTRALQVVAIATSGVAVGLGGVALVLTW